MRINFLCPTHRDWVLCNPEEAGTYLVDALDKGQTLMQHKQWRQAITVLGSAFESSTILLQHNIRESKLTVWLTSLAMLLAECFQQVKSYDDSQAVINLAQEYLQNNQAQFNRDPQQAAYMDACLAALERKSLPQREQYLEQINLVQRQH